MQIFFWLSCVQKFFGDNYYGEEDAEKPQFHEDFEGSDFFIIITWWKKKICISNLKITSLCW